MIVAGLAASLTRLGRRVLVAETHDQPFGVAFGFGIPTPRDDSQLVEAAADLWVSPVPLLGARRPGVLFDPPATADWQARATHADVVLVHVNHSHGLSRAPGMPIPDEYLVVAGEGAPDVPTHAYREIKRVVSWNPSVELGLIAVGELDEISGSARDKLVQAVATFLGRQCPLVGSVPTVSALCRAFISGTVLREGREEITPR
jgi:hypothetical protein